MRQILKEMGKNKRVKKWKKDEEGKIHLKKKLQRKEILK